MADHDWDAEIRELRVELDALDRLVCARLEAINDKITAQDEKVQLALQGSEKANSKAEAASDRRFEGVNEFRQTLADQAASFVTRNEVNVMVSANDARVDALTRLAVGTLITLLIAIVGVLLTALLRGG